MCYISQLHQDDIDKFDGELDDSMPPLCVIPVFGSPDDESMLHYSLSLEGGVEPIKRFFDLKLSSSSGYKLYCVILIVYIYR